MGNNISEPISLPESNPQNRTISQHKWNVLPSKSLVFGRWYNIHKMKTFQPCSDSEQKHNKEMDRVYLTVTLLLVESFVQRNEKLYYSQFIT